MPTRIPLVPAAPNDGKQYVQKNGGWVEPPKASAADDGLFSKEDKAALDALLEGGGGKTDEWISDLAHTNILLDKDGNAVTSVGGESIHLGSGDIDQQRYKGFNLTTSAPNANVFNSFVWVTGTLSQAVDAKKLPFIFASETDARLAAGWMIQNLATFLKSLENDQSTDSLLNHFTGYESKIKGGTCQTIGTADMDDNGWTYDSSTANTAWTSGAVSEWFEMIVGRNVAGDKYYTCWVLPFRLYDIATSANISRSLTSYVRWQTTAGEDFSTKPKVRYYVTGTPANALASDERDLWSFSNSNLPQLTQRDSGTQPRSGGQNITSIWVEPITLELNR